MKQEMQKRLKVIWDSKASKLGVTQNLMSERFNMGGQSTVSQYLSGRIPLNTEAIIKFAYALEVDLREIYPAIFVDLVGVDEPNEIIKFCD